MQSAFLNQLQSQWPLLEQRKNALDSLLNEYNNLIPSDQESHSPGRDGVSRRGATTVGPVDVNTRLKAIENKAQHEYGTLNRQFGSTHQQYLRRKVELTAKDQRTWTTRMNRLRSDIDFLGLKLEQRLNNNFAINHADRNYLMSGYDAEAGGRMNDAAKQKDAMASSRGMLDQMLDQGKNALSALAGQNQRILGIKAKEDDMSASAQASRAVLSLIENTLSSDRRLVLAGCTLTFIVALLVYWLVHG